MNHTTRRKGLRTLPRLVLAGAMAVSIAGCNTDELVEVQDPGALRPEDLANAGAIPALVSGAFRQFVGGYSGFGLDDAFLSGSGLITDEYYWGDTFTTRDAADHRNLQVPQLGNITDPAFTRLHQARFNARRAYEVVTEFTSPTTEAADAVTQAHLRSIEAYVYVTLSEGWCGAVPFSKVPDTGPIDPSAIEEGVSLNTVQMNDTAVLRFNEALALNAANRMAAVGKGRALLNTGRYAEAEAAVAAVPTTFVFLIEHSVNEATQNNPLFSLTNNGRYGVANLEGGLNATGGALRPDLPTPAIPGLPPTSAPNAEGLPFRAVRDPRVPWENRAGSGACFSSSVRCWLNTNYPNQDADIPLASGVEARLIEAEAALQRGDLVTYLARLNTLRASEPQLTAILYPNRKPGFVSNPLGALADPGLDPLLVTPAQQFAARADLLFRERAFWMFGTGHRQGDLRRLVRNYGRASNTVFPSGPHFRGGTYGNDVAYPVPFTEQNNKSYNPAACITTAS